MKGPRKPSVHVDLREATLAEVTDFVFDHGDVDVTVQIDPAHQLTLMAELFRGASALSPRYTAEQIDRGFSFMFTGHPEWFIKLLGDRDLPWAPRRAVIRAIYDLYDGLLCHAGADHTRFMLWDVLLDRFHDDTTEVADTCLETLVRILNLPDVECQAAALHGLGHLKHPQTYRVVSEFLRDQAPTDPDLIAYAERVRTGQFIL